MTGPRSATTSDAAPSGASRSGAASPYRGRTIAVGTRHGKDRQFAPAFRTVLAARLRTPPDLDTDRFGTFTGDVPRPGAPVDAARAKARLAMDLTDLPYGLASEASYGPLPGGWCGHEELLLFCDDRLGIEVLEGHRTASVPGTAQAVTGYHDVRESLLRGMPDQALIVRPSQGGGAIAKGVSGADALRRAIAAAVSASPDGLAVVEPDLRAHHNPSRRLILTDLAARLARRLATGCPSCGAPGFGRVDTRPGLPCRACATPTDLVRCEIHACAACGHRADRPVRGGADPGVCPACNP